MKLEKLINAVPCKVRGDIVGIDIANIEYDSRKVINGSLFVCLKGSAVDGHKFAEKAAESGAVAIVASDEIDVNVPVIMVEDTRKSLALLSAEFFGHPAGKLKTIGITGTKGKTTTACMLKYMLEAADHKVGVIGTIGLMIGNDVTPTNNTTPESHEVQKFMAQMVDAGCDYCIMEVSSIGLRDGRVNGFDFDCGIFTNFSEDHIGGVEHKDMEEYLYCKSLLFKKCKCGIINIDDANWEGMIKDHTCEIITYGFDNKADIVGSENHLYSEPGFIGSEMKVSGLENFDVKIATPGKFNAYNALSAITALHYFDISNEAMIAGLRAVKVKGRVEPVEVPGNFTLLIDYAHNALSMENILSTLREYNPNRLICMFGAGGNRPKVRRFEMGEVCGNMADLSVITADNSRFEDVMDIIADIKVGMAKTEGKYIEIPDRREAIRWCIENAEDGDIVVLAGKGHEDYQEIKGVKYPFDERIVIKEILADIEVGK
ncbi:MAG: UDP-N-acetylmuramoyl-L-alanyl-D-glutamate--2,6-diaminopimelate ligase [Clostridia bacterium]|nr:UDP-N-acetylmuramoyl-L-alanyl-D-glutamate--2,6-diaminopimelate ligase [Clostridia bacterium]